MDLNRRALLNEFGPVQHVVLESPEHRFVEVIFGKHNRKFVLTELTEELKKRSGLQLVPAHRLRDMPCIQPLTDVIVILDLLTIFRERHILQQIVERHYQPEVHTVFLQTEDYCPYWATERVPPNTLMLYPGSKKELLSQFWDTLSTVTGNPDMDPNRRALLNDFGRVQYVVLESPEHRFVQVIFSHFSRTFVLTELTEELDKRSGLQLVPAHRLRDLPCIKPRTDVIVILDNITHLQGRKTLQHTVERHDQPEVHTVFLQTDDYCPYWATRRVPPNTLMVYPGSKKELLSQFWDTLSTVTGTGRGQKAGPLTEKTRELTGSQLHDQKDSEESCSYHRERHDDQDMAVESENDLVAECMDADLIHSDTVIVESVTKDTVVVEDVTLNAIVVEDVTENAIVVEDVTENAIVVDGVTENAIVVEGATENAIVVEGATENAGIVEVAITHSNELPTTTGAHTVGKPDVDDQTTDGSFISDRDEEGDDVGRGRCSCCSTTDSSPTSSVADWEQTDDCENTEENDSTGDGCHTQVKQNDAVPSPIFAEDWQVSDVFSTEGGCLRQSDSDVVLDIPPDAVRDNHVEIHAAVCADVRHIREVLKLSDEIEVVSPLAEYWAGEDFHFQCPVSVVLPHCLPSDCDPHCVHIYHVFRDQQGAVTVSRLTREMGDKNGRFRDVTPTQGQLLDVGPADLTLSPSEEDAELDTESGAAAGTEQQKSSDDESERLGRFTISPEGRVTILTDTFCGYVCVRCSGKEKDTKPSLYMMGHVAKRSDRCIRISAYMWDARLKVKDFRKVYGMEPGDNTKRLDSLETIANTKVYMRLKLPKSSEVFHSQDEHGDPLLPESKDYDFPSLLSCKRCIKRGKVFPIKNDWVLEVRDGHMLRPDLTLAVDVSHVAANVTPAWRNVDFKEKLSTLVVEVPERERKNTEGGISDSSQWTQQLQGLSTAQLGDMAGKLGISVPPNPDRPNAESDKREHLIQRLIREGPIALLANLLAEMSLRHNGELPCGSSDQRKRLNTSALRARDDDISGHETKPKLYDTGSLSNGSHLNRSQDAVYGLGEYQDNLHRFTNISHLPPNTREEISTLDSLELVSQTHQKLSVSSGPSVIGKDKTADNLREHSGAHCGAERDVALNIKGNRSPQLSPDCVPTSPDGRRCCMDTGSEPSLNRSEYSGSRASHLNFNDLGSISSNELASHPLLPEIQREQRQPTQSRRKDEETESSDGMEDYFDERGK